MREWRGALDHPPSQTRLRLRLGLCLLCGTFAVQVVVSLAQPTIATSGSTMTGVASHQTHAVGTMAR